MLFTQNVHNIPQTGKKSWHGANQKAWLHRNPLFCYCLKDYYLHRILWGADFLAFLDYVCEMPFDDFNKRRAIINIFVQSIYLYDDHFTLIINASKKPLSIDNIPLDDIEEAFEGENTETEGCSSLMTPAPPL